MNGVKLRGNITWFDCFCVLLRRDGQSQLVYKHAISTVMPMEPDPTGTSRPKAELDKSAFVIHVEPKNRSRPDVALRDAHARLAEAGRPDG